MSRCVACCQEDCGYRFCDCACHGEDIFLNENVLATREQEYEALKQKLCGSVLSFDGAEELSGKPSPEQIASIKRLKDAIARNVAFPKGYPTRKFVFKEISDWIKRENKRKIQ